MRGRILATPPPRSVGPRPRNPLPARLAGGELVDDEGFALLDEAGDRLRDDLTAHGPRGATGTRRGDRILD